MQIPEQQNKGGRPRLPSPPKNVHECRELLAAQIVKTEPKRLGYLRTLLRSFEQAEQDALLAEQNRLQQETNELTRAEYLRRRELGLQRQRTGDGKIIARLREDLSAAKDETKAAQAEVVKLQAELEAVKTENERLTNSLVQRMVLEAKGTRTTGGE